MARARAALLGVRHGLERRAAVQRTGRSVVVLGSGDRDVLRHLAGMPKRARPPLRRGAPRVGGLRFSDAAAVPPLVLSPGLRALRRGRRHVHRQQLHHGVPAERGGRRPGARLRRTGADGKRRWRVRRSERIYDSLPAPVSRRGSPHRGDSPLAPLRERAAAWECVASYRSHHSAGAVPRDERGAEDLGRRASRHADGHELQSVDHVHLERAGRVRPGAPGSPSRSTRASSRSTRASTRTPGRSGTAETAARLRAARRAKRSPSRRTGTASSSRGTRSPRASAAGT